DTSDRTVKYGRWSSHPETRIPFGRLFVNPVGLSPVVVPDTHRDLPNAGDSWKVGARVTNNFGKLNVGLGYIWGFNPQGSDMVFKMKGAPALCGPPACPPNGTQIRLHLINDRTNIFAGQFNYPIAEALSLPVNTTVRGELAF